MRVLILGWRETTMHTVSLLRQVFETQALIHAQEYTFGAMNGKHGPPQLSSLGQNCYASYFLRFKTGLEKGQHR